jgi:HlyD family secretion protein
MKNVYQKINTFVRSHKWWSGLIAVVIIFAGYSVVKAMTSTSGDPSYVTTTATTGSVASSVTGTGQVSTSNQLDLDPQASGNVVYIGVADGQNVTAGTLIAELDTTTAEKAVRDAEVSLQSAQLSYQKLIEPATALSLTQAQNAVSSAQIALTNSYTNSFTSVSTAFLDLPTVMTGLNDVLSGTEVNKQQDNLSAYADMVQNPQIGPDPTVLAFKNDALEKYQTALTDYNNSLAAFQLVSLNSSTTTVESLVNSTYNTVQNISEAVKSANDFLNLVKSDLTAQDRTIPAILTTQQNSISTYTSQINTDLSSLLNGLNTITSSQNSLTENIQSLAQLQAGPDPISVQSSELNVTQAQNALIDAKNNLADYYVYAPFDGTVASVNVQVGQAAGTGTSVATFITQQKIADVSLNEVDAAKVQNGQKVTLTFTAIPNLTIAGVVDQVDTIGTVSQGVVTYNVKIGFDTQDPRVKSGMSVNAAIVTAIDQNVVVVPSSAVKTQGTTSYVQVFNPPLANSSGSSGAASKIPPTNQIVTIGLSDGTNTEIVSGLKVGDQVVTRTIAGSGAKTTTSTTPSLLGGSAAGRAGGGGFGGGVRIGG